MGDVPSGHGEDGDLCDGSLLALDPSGTLVQLCEVGVHVSGVTAPSGHFLTGGSDLTERLAVVRDVGHDDQHLHAQVERHVLRGGQTETRGEGTLDGGVVGEVQEDHGVLQSAGPLELLHEHLLLFVGDTHGDEHDGELLVLSADLRLPGDLKSDLVVRETGLGEDRQLLTPDQGVHSIDGGDTGLDEIRRAVPCPGVDGRSDDVELFLGHDPGTAVQGLSGSGEDPAEHVLGDGHLHGLAEEAHGCVLVDTGGSLEHLDDHEVVGRVEDLSPPHGAVGHPDVDHLVVTDGLRVLDVHEGTRDLGDRLVLFGNVCHWNHTPSSANCLSMSSLTA